MKTKLTKQSLAKPVALSMVFSKQTPKEWRLRGANSAAIKLKQPRKHNESSTCWKSTGI
jgi:hypothetical protein